MSNRYLLADRVAALLTEFPEGLTSTQIYDRLVDDHRNGRLLPSRNAMGSRLSAMVGIEKAGYGVGHSAMTTRRVVLWCLNAERYARWRHG